MRKTHLPIAQPCHENWDAMDPVQRGRFCHSCSKQVYHLSDMTEREATSLLQRSKCSGERICVRYSCDREGVIQFRPEKKVAAAAAAVLSVALAACTPHDNGEQQHRASILPVPTQVGSEPEIVMGEMPAEPMIDPEPQTKLVPLMGEPVQLPDIEPVEEVEELMGDVEYVPEDEEPQPCALTKPQAAAAARAHK